MSLSYAFLFELWGMVSWQECFSYNMSAEQHTGSIRPAWTQLENQTVLRNTNLKRTISCPLFQYYCVLEVCSLSPSRSAVWYWVSLRHFKWIESSGLDLLKCRWITYTFFSFWLNFQYLLHFYFFLIHITWISQTGRRYGGGERWQWSQLSNNSYWKCLLNSFVPFIFTTFWHTYSKW